ncbi:MAG: hypothetical protein ABI286_01790 [Edaphobacter sp.]
MTTALQSAVSESTASTHLREGGAIVRKAKLPDAVNIFDLVNSIFLDCGALHLYGSHCHCSAAKLTLPPPVNFG